MRCNEPIATWLRALVNLLRVLIGCLCAYVCCDWSLWLFSVLISRLWIGNRSLVSCRHHGQSSQDFLGEVVVKRRLNAKLYSFSSPGASQQSSYRGRDYPISCQCSVDATSGPLTCKPRCSDSSVVMVSGEASVAWSCTIIEESCGANSKGIYGKKTCFLIIKKNNVPP